jgi:hypothetical protein
MTPEQRQQARIIKREYANKQRDHDSALQALIALGDHPADAAEMLFIASGDARKYDSILREYSENLRDRNSALEALIALGSDPANAEELLSWVRK